MTSFFIYLAESTAVLALLYLLYVLALSKETFFNLNRFFLIGILVFSLVFPFLSFDFNQAEVVAVELSVEEISKFRKSYYEALALWDIAGRNAVPDILNAADERQLFVSDKKWLNLVLTGLLAIYISGILFCLSRLIWAIRRIRKMISNHFSSEIEGVKVVSLPYATAPFSFLKFVFVHEALLNTQDFEQIMAHEKTHINERHTIDLIFVQLVASFLWFNPVVWWVIKSLKTTHEYIADRKTISSGYSLVAYQTLLLRQLISNNSYGLVHNFNLTFIKKRITMMKNKSGWAGKVRVAVAIVCTVLFSGLIVQCNSRLEEEQGPLQPETASTHNTIVDLPVLPDRKNYIVADLKDALDFSIRDNQLEINGVSYSLDDIGPFIEKGHYSQPVAIKMSIDKNQKMAFVRKVQMELRKADQRKLIYRGKTADGKNINIPLLLPPLPNSESGEEWLLSNDELSAAGLDVFKIDLGGTAGAANQKKVYDFVKSQMTKQSSDYVVSATFDEADVYGNYLANLVYVQSGFNQIYEERAQEMFGKDYYSIGKEEFAAVRLGVPMAISVADVKL